MEKDLLSKEVIRALESAVVNLDWDWELSLLGLKRVVYPEFGYVEYSKGEKLWQRWNKAEE